MVAFPALLFQGNKSKRERLSTVSRKRQFPLLLETVYFGLPGFIHLGQPIPKITDILFVDTQSHHGVKINCTHL
jgi:hypothetical protein